MHCIECDKDCAMKYERNADIQTPCLVCVRGESMPEPECWKCIKGDCHFVEREKDVNNAELQRLF